MTIKQLMKSVLAFSMLGATMLSGVAPVSASVLGDDYPVAWKSGAGADSWGMYLRQCTSFVAFRLSSANHFELPAGYGNAVSWGSAALSNGYQVDMNPQVGSVAWFSSGVGGAGSYGHVAWVAAVDGDRVTLEEYNYDFGQGPEQYYTRTIDKNEVSGYIHFKDLSAEVGLGKSSSKPKQLAKQGNYTFTKSTSVYDKPSTSSTVVATYESGASVHYDQLVEENGYQWLSYIGYSGKRRYIPVNELAKPQATQLAPTSPAKPKLADHGTYQFTKRAVIRSTPSLDSPELAYYDKGMSVVYDKVINQAGQTWLSYLSYSGARRYVAIDTSETNATAPTTTNARRLTYNGAELSEDVVNIILTKCKEYDILPSFAISLLHFEGLWGNSTVGRVDNNWGGMTWTGNPNRPSGVTVSRGMARPANEGGYYMHYDTVEDFLTDWFYLLRTGGGYNVAGQSTFEGAVAGLFRAGGATYDYAAADYSNYLAGISSRMHAIEAENGSLDF